MTNTAYLSLGSNINPEENLKAAVAMLARLTHLTAVSSVWETAPLGVSNQPDFLNAAAIIQTVLSADTLKTQVLGHIEQALGRVRQGDKFGPRPMDIDIIFFNNQILTLQNGRHIPNPEVLERPFVAIPLAEIAPDYLHPETGQSLRQIAAQFEVNPRQMRLRAKVSADLAQFNKSPE